MSAGICVMNRNAIALAADSAVTVGQHVAIHNSANKLFSLSKYEPVGVIIYANVEFMQVPMEIILKQYKKDLDRKAFSTLIEYIENFIDYLESNVELLRFDKNEKNFVECLYINFLNGLAIDYKNFTKEKVKKVKRELTEKEQEEVQLKVYKQTINYIDSLVRLQNTSFATYIKNTYLDNIKQYITNEFNWMTTQQIEELSDKICEIYDTEFYRNGYVGIAFAGYGTKEIFPQMCHLILSGVIDRKVRYIRKEYNSISEQTTATITPLAQTDVMQTFLFGINDTIIQDIAHEIPKQISERISNMDASFFTEGNKGAVLKELHGATPSIISRIAQSATNRYMTPIIQSVASLPIEELALLAESMINITSLRRKVALDGNVGTVGGPIDVAIISRGDGFIWIKQKHYFDMNFNPQYVMAHYFNYNNQDEHR